MGDMGTTRSFRQSPKPGQPIVAFDFDGTLTIRDSFTAFLKWKVGPERWRTGLLAMAPQLAAYALDRDRQRLKEAAVRRFLPGMGAVALGLEAEQFAHEQWDRLMRPDALCVWNDWGRRGAYRAIVTASPALTVQPFADRLGADALLGTDLVTDASGWFTGAFAGPNCRGEEKVRRLRAAFGPEVRLAAAYGDTSGDTEMLAIAGIAGFRVFKGKP
ncbi:HAD-IB family hydrolase [Brevundimonas sp. AJA228-03]|uniref:HAD-IB family hydrolase n=1 Tax=Brevundimonas sp. AJA228-03 TaxID=2752515 RepID=UPI001AE0BA2B|nr:HAD-IB family hydrolase [Brevundimonas sp. AJA228-03]QTN18255.1 HAD-IB family hydrolase [Brevundimonas sp. AJA228-03]